MKRITLRSSTALALVKMLKRGNPTSFVGDVACRKIGQLNGFRAKTVGMSVRIAGVLIVALATPAAADTFGGFSGVDKPYLVNSDRVCTPLKVEGGKAAGAPACEKLGADVIAKLSVKDPIPQSGPKAAFAASASGRTLTVSKKASGEPVIVWQTMDPIGKVVEVYASQYEDRVAVAYTARVMGKEQTLIVAFDLLKAGVKPTVKDPPLDPNKPVDPNDPNAPKDPNTGVAPEDPKVLKAVEAARKAPKAKALAEWQKVLAVDPGHSETFFRIAALQLASKSQAEALRSLETLAKSSKPDAIEWLIEARFDPAFATLRAEPRFRAATGLDRKPATSYERLMIFGGQWEQTGTSCDKPEVRLKLARDRSFRLNVKTNCQGSIMDLPFKGKWRVEPTGLTLILPNQGKASAADEAPCKFEPIGDEDSLHCDLGKGIDFVVLPTRR